MTWIYGVFSGEEIVRIYDRKGFPDVGMTALYPRENHKNF
jgi:hypothetical protein